VGTILGLERRLRLEIFAYIMIVSGTLGDHFSTVVALARPYIYEANPFTVQLMARGLWLPLDILLIIAGILIPYLLIRLARRPYANALLAYPIVYGIIRLGACFWNLSLIV
jgi:hypothetical protein